jgi:DNA-nicking Smr family endonuclease
MSKPGKSASSRRGILTEEDEELWASVAQNLEPVRRKERVHGAFEPAKSPEMRQHELKRGGYGSAPQAHPPVKPRPLAPPPTVRSNPPPAVYDRTRARKLAAGRMAIEARLDLHGLRQSEAHMALRAFLFACHGKGLRNVLIITGKGGSADDDASSRFDLFDRRDRGILKRNVPRWLAEPELRALVVGYTTAHARHGGEGALYLQLRRRERVRDRR